jgi:hypothetical protein
VWPDEDSKTTTPGLPRLVFRADLGEAEAKVEVIRVRVS